MTSPTAADLAAPALRPFLDPAFGTEAARESTTEFKSVKLLAGGTGGGPRTVRSSVCFQGRPAVTCRKEGKLEALLHSLEVLAKAALLIQR